MNLNFKNRFGHQPKFPRSRTALYSEPFFGNRMVQAHRLFCLIVSLAIVLSSCKPKPATPSPTSIPPQPTNTRLATASNESLIDTATPLPEATRKPSASSTPLESGDTLRLIPARAVRAYPGPEHYAGDIITFEIQTDGSLSETSTPVTLKLDGREVFEVSGQWTFFNTLVLPLALDTSDLTGSHRLEIRADQGNIHELYSFQVLPAIERPEQEESAAWMVTETPCCVLHYVSGTAAARDIEFIAEHFQQAAEDFSKITERNIDPKLEVYFIDRIWGNGGFGGNGELVASYTDRYYGPTVGSEGLETLARHEFTHAAGVGIEAGGDGIEFNYEGLAVYVAGGHYKPEPLAQRGAALYDLGYYVPPDQYLEQHEAGYLYSAAMLTYIVETYSLDALWQFLAADEIPQDGEPGSLDAAIQSTFDISLKDFDTDFQNWLARHEPGGQLDDLRLTIELQDLRREYQETYAPPPYFIFGKATDVLARPEYLPVVTREANSPANVAIELIIANGQKAIIDGNYVEAEQLIEVVSDVLSTGNFEDPLAKEYLGIVLSLADAGYEALSLDVQDDQVTAQVTIEAPVVTSLELQKINGTWQVKP
jgi:hypothetical protein